MPDKINKLQKTQSEFASYLRDEQGAALPSDIEARRLDLYRETFYNNIKSLLSNNFPILHAIMKGGRWDALVHDFYANYRCHTPFFHEIAAEFIQFLQTQRMALDDPPFIIELAHYEWVEMALDISDREISELSFDPNANLANTVPVISPLVMLLQYQFPVHRIALDNQPETSGDIPTFILAHRDLNDEIHFTEINLLTAKLMSILQKEGNTVTGMEALKSLTKETRQDENEFIKKGLDLLRQFQIQNIILGGQIHG